eukprot:8265471-Pyramimonas_sp.AAC.1
MARYTAGSQRWPEDARRSDRTPQGGRSSRRSVRRRRRVCAASRSCQAFCDVDDRTSMLRGK